MSAVLHIEFEGWCLIRLATDPDPADEPRGVSGYSFAFAGEPDLDRIVRLQAPLPGDPVQPRSHGPAIGVRVRRATRRQGAAVTDVLALANATVDLLDRPKLEQRNWILTRAAYEPIVPFHLLIQKDEELSIRRFAPLDPTHPERPVWQVETAGLEAQGARGIEPEPETVGLATGIWDPLQEARVRRAKLQAERDELARRGESDSVVDAALEARIAQLDIGIDSGGRDRRVSTRVLVERFGFEMHGEAQVGDMHGLLGGTLDCREPWQIAFWMGAWDVDTLSCFMQGVLKIPYRESA